MAKKQSDEEGIFPIGAFFSVHQLPCDLLPKPAAQRIVQLVHYGDGKLRCFFSENAYHRGELFEIHGSLFRRSFDLTVVKGFPNLGPHKGKIHWCEFTEEFYQKGKGPRINPETGKPENE